MPHESRYVDFPTGVRARPSRRSSLAAEPYTAPEQLAREWDRVWTRAWLFAGLESDLANPGDWFVFEIGRESIIVLRDEEGAVSAFYNVCQHRGNRLLGDERGCARALACPYHGWTYDLRGRLEWVPDEERFEGGVDRNQRSLKPVRVERWAGMVWVNMDPSARALSQYLGPIMGQLEPYRFDQMHLVKHQTVSLGANWKTVRDNFLEQYHVDFIHPQHASMYDCANSTNELWPYGHSRSMVPGFTTNPRYPTPEEPPDFIRHSLRGLGMDPSDWKGRVNEVRAAIPEAKRRVGAQLGYDNSGLTDEQLTDTWQYDIFPNVFFTIRSEELWIFGPRPHRTDPDRCVFDKWTLQIPKEIAIDRERRLALGIDPTFALPSGSQRPAHEVFTRADVVEGRHTMTITVDQDIACLDGMQAGLHSRGFDRAILSEDESRVRHFHDWLDEWLAGDPLGG